MNFLWKNRLKIDPYFLIILVVFFVSRLFIHLILKIEFTYYFKDYLIQYLELESLKNNLLQNVFYLHSQPPLFNFSIGLCENILGKNSSFIFAFLFRLMGFLTAILGFRVLEKLNVNKNLALSVILFYILTPATILYENLFFYTHVIIFFLVSSTYYLLKFINLSNFKNALLIFTGTSLAILITSFFHLIWFIIVFIFLSIVKKSSRKILVKGAAFPFIIILALYLKNFLVFGFFGSSSWVGMNLSRITVHQLGPNQKENLIENKKLSELTSIAPFTQYIDMDSVFVEEYFGNYSGIIVLDKPEKKNGRTNYNHSAYLDISAQLLKDDLFIITHYPQVYIKGILKAFTLYFDSPTKYKLISANAFKIKAYNKFFDAFVYGSSTNTKTGYTTILMVTFIIISSVYLLFISDSNYLLKVFIAFSLINIFYVMFVGNLLEYGENNRFRYYTEIFYYLLFGVSINELIIKPLFLKMKNKA